MFSQVSVNLFTGVSLVPFLSGGTRSLLGWVPTFPDMEHHGGGVSIVCLGVDTYRDMGYNGIRSASGRYVSYWNVFLLMNIFSILHY